MPTSREATTELPPPPRVPGDHNLRTDLEALAHGWRNLADSDRVTSFGAAAYRLCAEEVELALARHSPTDPAPPPSTRETQATIPDGRGA